MRAVHYLVITLLLAPVLGGCALGAAAGAGYVAGDEIEEGDEFDPGEDFFESDN